VDGGGGDEGVDAKRLCHFQGFAGGIDVFLQGASQCADPAVLDVAGDGLNRLKIAGEETGKPTSMISTPSRSSAWRSAASP
jgi:hypothetical protein